MNQTTPVLALDFDGVIVDSAEEVLQTALETWSEMFPESLLADDIRHRLEARRVFERLVPLGNRAEDFGVALHIISAGLDVVSQDDYDRIRTDLGSGWLRSFHTLFYRTRERIRSDEFDRWLGLHSVYRPFVDVLARHRHGTTLSIATAKDGESVRLLLRQFKIDHLFDDKLILDKETGVSKITHLHAVAEQLGCEFHRITFIDDKLNHLVATAPLGVKGVLASWGHNTANEHKAARKAGFAVATLENVEPLLFPA